MKQRLGRRPEGFEALLAFLPSIDEGEDITIGVTALTSDLDPPRPPAYTDPFLMVASTKNLPVARALADLFLVRGGRSVEGVTTELPQLVPLLHEAHGQVQRVFGAEAPLVLEVVANPEASDATPDLFLYVQTQLSVAAARERLAQLDDEWWLDALPRAEGRLAIALEYV